MRCTLEQLRKTKVAQTPHNQALIAEAIKVKGAKADVLHMGTVGYPIVQPDVSRPLDRKRRARQNGAVELVAIVTIIRVGYKECDDDSLIPGAKALRDSIAASLGVDDGDKRIRWRYSQARVDDGRTGTIVKIDQV
jgi:hypothetical protein